jgi:preprotein translocase subunit YajC
MTLRSKLFLSTLSAALFVAAVPAAAQASANFAAGAKVSDTQGGEVGTITSVDGDFVILKTDKHEVRLPKASFTAHQGGFIMAMTQAQVNAAVEQTQAQAEATLVAGALVRGNEGGQVGTIDAIDDQFATIKLTSGKLVRLPRTAIAAGTNGALIGMTVAELEAAASEAAAASAAVETTTEATGSADSNGASR